MAQSERESFRQCEFLGVQQAVVSICSCLLCRGNPAARALSIELVTFGNKVIIAIFMAIQRLGMVCLEWGKDYQ